MNHAKTPLLCGIGILLDLHELEKSKLRQLSNELRMAPAVDARFAKPLDTELAERLINEHEIIIAIKEASIGGFATQAFEHLARNDLIQNDLKMRSKHLTDRFQDQASPLDKYNDADFNANHIVRTALRSLGAEKTAADIQVSA